jgi:hypothetical protein
MGLKEDIQKDFIQALKQKSDNLSVLKSLKASLQNKEISLKRKELNEEEIVSLIRQEIKKRQEAQEVFSRVNRPIQAEKEKLEMNFLKKYLPPELSLENLNQIVDQAIKDLKAIGRQDFGRVMKEVMAKVKGQAEGSKIKEIVEKKLG